MSKKFKIAITAILISLFVVAMANASECLNTDQYLDNPNFKVTNQYNNIENPEQFQKIYNLIVDIRGDYEFDVDQYIFTHGIDIHKREAFLLLEESNGCHIRTTKLSEILKKKIADLQL